MIKKGVLPLYYKGVQLGLAQKVSSDYKEGASDVACDSKGKTHD